MGSPSWDQPKVSTKRLHETTRIGLACFMGAHCSGTGYKQTLWNKVNMAFYGAVKNVDLGFTSMFIFMGMLSTF